MQNNKIKLIILALFAAVSLNGQTPRIYNVAWYNLEGYASFYEDTLKCTANSSAPAVATSRNRADIGETGNVEFFAHQTGKNKSLGLTSEAAINGIEYYFNFSGNYYTVVIKGTVKVSSTAYSLRDKFKILLKTNSIEFYCNGIKIYTHTESGLSAKKFRIKAYMTNLGAAFAGVKTSFRIPWALNPYTDDVYCNYIRETTPLEALTTIDNNTSPSGDVRATVVDMIQYIDGLGRPMHNTTMVQSPSFNNYEQIREYDNITGLELKTNLPYTIAVDNLYPEGRDYSEKVTDGSPLNRIVEISGPGADLGAHPSKFEYGFNTTAFKRFRVDDNAQTVTINIADNNYVEPDYPVNDLFLVTSFDENNNKTEEYKDDLGHVVMKRSFTGSSNLTTYYVYDAFSRLRLVIPPKAYDSLVNTTYALTDPLIKNLCYYYKYDKRGNMTIKRIPGADDIYMVYNSRDQLVMSQDGVQRPQKKWNFIKYASWEGPL